MGGAGWCLLSHADAAGAAHRAAHFQPAAARPAAAAVPASPPAPAPPLPAGKAAKEAGASSPENQFIRGVIALHDKYMEYVQVRGARLR